MTNIVVVYDSGWDVPLNTFLQSKGMATYCEINKNSLYHHLIKINNLEEKEKGEE